MKAILNIVIAILVFGCGGKTEKSDANELKAEIPTSTEVVPVKPCELFGKDQLVSVFNIKDLGSIEMFTKKKYNTTNQCQFIWPEEKGSVKASQIMIDISSKSPNDGSLFSRQLELDLQKGLSAYENGKVTIIKPKKIEGFGNFAYQWEQPNFQNTQKIKFQLNNLYKVEVMFNSNTEVSQKDIENKLVMIGQILKQKLNQ